MPLPPLMFEVDLDGADMLGGAGLSGDEITQALRRGAMAGAQLVRSVWIQMAMSQGMNQRGSYMKALNSDGAIRVIKEPSGAAGEKLQNVEIIVEVVNSAKEASYIEEGHAAFHMPSVMSWSSDRVKISKAGKRYIHIPFRHYGFESAGERDTGGMTDSTKRAMMPQEVYQAAKKLEATIRMKHGPQYDKKGQYLRADNYKWGGRLKRPARAHQPRFIMGGPVAGGKVAGAGGPGEPGFEETRSVRQVAGRSSSGDPLINPAWKTSKYDGMVRTDHKTVTGGSHSQYTTIRTMTEDSEGWNIPAQPGRFIAARTLRYVQRGGRLERAIMMGLTGPLGIDPGGV